MRHLDTTEAMQVGGGEVGQTHESAYQYTGNIGDQTFSEAMGDWVNFIMNTSHYAF